MKRERRSFSGETRDAQHTPHTPSRKRHRRCAHHRRARTKTKPPQPIHSPKSHNPIRSTKAVNPPHHHPHHPTEKMAALFAQHSKAAGGAVAQQRTTTRINITRPAGLASSGLRSSGLARVSVKRNERVCVVRATAEEQGEPGIARGEVKQQNEWHSRSLHRHRSTSNQTSPPHTTTEVKEVVLGKPAAAPADGDSWVPICRPEDLPKGERRRTLCARCAARCALRRCCAARLCVRRRLAAECSRALSPPRPFLCRLTVFFVIVKTTTTMHH